MIRCIIENVVIRQRIVLKSIPRKQKISEIKGGQMFTTVIVFESGGGEPIAHCDNVFFGNTQLQGQ